MVKFTPSRIREATWCNSKIALRPRPYDPSWSHKLSPDHQRQANLIPTNTCYRVLWFCVSEYISMVRSGSIWCSEMVSHLERSCKCSRITMCLSETTLRKFHSLASRVENVSIKERELKWTLSALHRLSWDLGFGLGELGKPGLHTNHRWRINHTVPWSPESMVKEYSGCQDCLE